MELPVNYNNINPKDKKLVREEYIKQQDGKCYHCKEPLINKPSEDALSKIIHEELYPPGFFNYPVHLHHSHDTGMTLGAVHNHCNAVLWEHHGE